MGDSAWKIAASFTYPHEAHIAEGFLNSEGIETMLKDELTAQAYNFSSNAIGGVKILVPENQFQDSIQILKKGGFIQTREETLQSKIVNVKKTKETPEGVCPFCKSDNFSEQTDTSSITAFVFLLLGLFLPVFRKSYKCFNCQKVWRYI